MSEELAAVSLTLHQWAIVQEALDAFLYEVEHPQPGGTRRSTKERSASRRKEVLRQLPLIAEAIAEQAGEPAL